jgi:hypothetical protein
LHSGSVRLRESSGSVQASTGTALPFFKQAQAVGTVASPQDLRRDVKVTVQLLCRLIELQCIGNVLQNSVDICG